MANYNTDNYSQVPFSGEYGNKSVGQASFASIAAVNGSAGFANGDTFDIMRLPGGARVLSGFIYMGSSAAATSTLVVGIKYADGTSTGGTTGTAVLVAGTASAIVASHTAYALRFTPFRNDTDTIVYATWLSPGAPAGATGTPMDVVVEFIATGQP